MKPAGLPPVSTRAILERATAIERSVVAGRFLIHARRRQRPWVVVVEPQPELQLLVVVTVY
jgi:hypothetical protein